MKELRERRGFSQNRLAELASMDQGQISKYEAGRMGVTLTNAVIIARVLGVTLDELVCGEGPRPAADDGGGPVDDPYPNRHRLRQLPEFREAPEIVQNYLVTLRRRTGDMTYFQWVAELERLIKVHDEGEWDSLFEGRDLRPRPRLR